MKEALAYFPYKTFPVIALLLFFSIYMGVVFWTGLSKNKSRFEEMKKLPLGDSQS